MYRRAALHVYRLYQKTINVGLASGIVGVVLVSSLVGSPAASAISIGGPSDCDSNAIVHCGVHSTSEVVNAYNSSAYVRGVYAAFGINQADIANLPSTDVPGRVTKDGNVFVDGKSQAVATNAVTGGRQDMPGSTKVNYQGAVFYRRPPNVSFQQDSLPAFVSMQNGVFQFAVIASCGNAVRATAAQQPTPNAVGQAHAVSTPQAKPQPKPAATPAPAPAPTQSQTQSQSQEVNVANNNTNYNEQTTVSEQRVKTVPAPSPSAPAPAPTQSTPTATTTVQPATQTTSAVLPNTGPAGTVGVFLISATLGMFGYRRLLMAKLEN